MIPPRRIHTRTLAFAGVVRTPVTATIAEMQALWLCAFFDHRLPHLEPSTIPPSPSSLNPDDALPSPKLSTPAVEKGPDDVKLHDDDQQQQRAMSEISARVRYDAILHARYGAWRYPAGFGGVLPDFFFDTLPLFDLMLAELGLPRWRKGSFVKEVFSSALQPSICEVVSMAKITFQALPHNLFVAFPQSHWPPCKFPDSQYLIFPVLEVYRLLQADLQECNAKTEKRNIADTVYE
ncbi:hypothetical protein DBV05_g12676 [Lasiodiplodia theobromae]|uniref:Uncharacterized protein n=1 Tax=Lasiodiplodia theobromae TaxID=45133 RepID=A0A5N5CTH6_9PEZI|nr:hypothetical protein DBV05_g12676 [Lasiodiplodia theobromae]